MASTDETLTEAGEEVQALNRQPSPQIVVTRSADHPGAMEEGTRNQSHPDKADAALSQFHERAISEVRERAETTKRPNRIRASREPLSSKRG